MGQLTLDLGRDDGPAVNLHDYDLTVICSSAGKDSLAMLAHLAELITAQGYRGRVVVVHNHLGYTAAGEPVEWPGAEQLARETAEMFGFEFVVRARPRGGLVDQLVNERRKWPGAGRARWCTGDQKTGPTTTWITQAVAQLGVDGPARVLYCLGLRAAESSGRAAQPRLMVDERRSSGRRTITRWLPIHGWTVREVWERIRAAGIRPHAAYSWGMARLSCSLCVLASLDDLMLAAALRPRLAADYAEIEAEIGHRFTHAVSVAELLAALGAASAEAAGEAGAADEALALYELVRSHLAVALEGRGEKEITRRATAQTGRLLASARRAVELAARADTSAPLAGLLGEGDVDRLCEVRGG